MPDLKQEKEQLRRANLALRIAFNNVSQEREFLRDEVKELRTLAREAAELCQRLSDACKMYEGQKNAITEEEIQYAPECNVTS